MEGYIKKESVCAWLENMGFSDFIIRTIESEKHFPTADVVPRETVEQIFEEIDKLAKEGGVIWTNYARAVLAELKKKYTEWQFSEQISYEQPDLTDASFIDSEGNEHELDEQWERADELYKKYSKGEER